MKRVLIICSIVAALTTITRAEQTSRTLDRRFHHLRIDGPREWSVFPRIPSSAHLDVRFQANQNQSAQTLRLRQQDVKETWDVLLNGKSLGRLVRDENDMAVCFSVPANAVVEGENRLQVLPRSKTPDDIRVGHIELDSRPLIDVLNESTLDVEVTDGVSGQPIPARITITDLNGVLQTTGATSNDHLAVRPGIIYTSTGKARIGLPPGEYKVYVGRGFEYSLGSSQIKLVSGKRLRQSFTIRREVPTTGYVACDTHVHTRTHSGHGDATVDERMITLAAEGIELPIAADHNAHIDHAPFARKMNVRRYFTPVIGNEVTTRVGHFNVFPVDAGARIADHKLDDWKSVLNDIYRTPGVKVAILNHARDLHSGIRPFGAKRFNAVVGERFDGWGARLNAMEVINSGATQSDPLRLFHDWMALLNRGHSIAPIGSSDSHDVARHFVGQGRTYIRCDDRDPSNINVDEAVNNLLLGRVMVSYGLLAEIKVASKYTSGELASVTGEEMRVAVRVLGPHWVKATQVRLFSNGQQIRSINIPSAASRNLPRGIKWQGEWTLPRPNHDVHLVAIATGPGIDGPYWKTAKPYQPLSPDWDPVVIGCSGAVWLDVDGDGQKTAAYTYAQRLFAESAGNLQQLLDNLAGYDQAIAAQAASLYQSSFKSLLTPAAREMISKANDNTKTGFQRYLESWRENQIAHSSP